VNTDSREYIVVTVEGSVPLGSQTVSIGLKRDGTRTDHPAEWVGSTSTQATRREGSKIVTYYTRDARILVGPGGTPSVGALDPGPHTVTCKVTDSPEAPVLDVYAFYVTEA
jgi:hypothetical protein